VKRWGFRRDKKMVMDSESWMAGGKEFQSLGSSLEKALSLKLWSLDLGKRENKTVTERERKRERRRERKRDRERESHV
jgi:hypothetical protein